MNSTVAEETKTEEKKEEVVWERWSKKRTFVRALEGTYGELITQDLSHPGPEMERRSPDFW